MSLSGDENIGDMSLDEFNRCRMVRIKIRIFHGVN